MANPKFRSLLATNNATTADTTNAIKKLIGEYEVLETALPELKSQLKKKDLTEKDKKELTEELADVEENLPLLETRITQAVTDWLPKRQQIAERTQRMNAGKANKNAGSKNTPAAPAAAAAPAAKAIDTPPAPPKPAPAAQQTNQPPAASSSSSQEGKKSRNPILGIGIAILGGIAAGFGISLFFKRD